MAVRSARRGSVAVHLNDLADPNLRLDLTSPLWELKDGQVSEALGVDVVLPGRIRPDRGRKPVGVSLPESDRPVSSAQGLDVSGRLSLRYRSLQGHTNLFVVKQSVTTTYDPANGQLTGTGAFTGYTRFRETDKILIHLPAELRGIYPVLSFTDANTIVIPAGLTAANTTVTDFVIIEGKQIVEYAPAAGGLKYLVKSPALYAEEGPWDADMNRAVFWFGAEASPWREDQIAANLQQVSLGTFGQENDALIGPEWDDGDDVGLTVLFAGDRDRRGILITNGRKFWIQKSGVLTLLMDLGSDIYLGAVWRAARIATNRLLLVTAKYAPRVLHLDRDSTTPTFPAGDETLAGCIPPRKPVGVELWTEKAGILDKYVNPSWLMKAVGSGGSMTVGEIKALVRGVNLEDNLTSAFVPVLRAQDFNIPTQGFTADGDWILPVVASDSVGVFAGINSDDNAAKPNFSPIIHGRITHIEIWRTPAGEPGNYYLEARAALYDPERVRNTASGTIRGLFDPEPTNKPITLADGDLLRLPILTNPEFDAGGLPPICRDAVSLSGVTLCFGKAASDKVDPTVYAKNFFGITGGYNPSTGRFTQTGSFFNLYFFYEGDEIVVVNGGAVNGSSMSTGVYEIKSRVDANNVELDKNLTPAGVSPADIHFYLRRPYVWPWPFVASDEDVWYSRTDLFAPEGFPPRIRTLSKTGDTFRRVVVTGKYAVVVMDQAVHLLWIDGVNLLKDTLATKGVGTPWPDSVVVFERRVLWATPQGMRSLEVSNEPDTEGHRGRISLSTGLELQRWFQEAGVDGDTIDAGVDVKNATLRLRRRSADTTAGSLSAFLASSRRAEALLDPGIGGAEGAEGPGGIVPST